MIENRYINEYLKDCFNYPKNISKLLVLKKRGFYIDISPEGDISLNDFSCSKDRTDFLNLWEMSLDEIINTTFVKDSVYNQPVCCPPGLDKWRRLFGSNRMYGSKVPSLFLEPFISRFIHALALSGIFTFYSCDGWHKSPRKNSMIYIGFEDRYSMLWLVAILKSSNWWSKNVLFQRGNHSLEIPISTDNRFILYKQVDDAARIIYENRELFRQCKQEIKTELSGMRKDSLSDDVVLSIFTDFWVKRIDLITNNLNVDNLNNISDEKEECFISGLRKSVSKKSSKSKTTSKKKL